MSIESEATTDVTFLKGYIAKLEAEAKSIWARSETYGYVIGAFILGGFIGHFV